MITGWTIQSIERGDPHYWYHNFKFWHENYDGAEDGNNHLTGFGSTLLDCWEQIQDLEDTNNV